MCCEDLPAIISVTHNVLQSYLLPALLVESGSRVVVSQLTHSCLETSLTIVVCTCDTFENNFDINHKLGKYLKGSCQLVNN